MSTSGSLEMLAVTLPPSGTREAVQDEDQTQVVLQGIPAGFLKHNRHPDLHAENCLASTKNREKNKEGLLPSVLLMGTALHNWKAYLSLICTLLIQT